MAELSSRVHIVGRACRVPGAPDVGKFWDNLVARRCSVTSIGPERWEASRYWHPRRGEPGKAYTFAAGVLDDIWGFDPAAFGISPREAAQMDPQQRLILELVWEAFEDAGIRLTDVAGQKVGVYIGGSSLDYANSRLADPSGADAYFMTGNTLSLLSNRISYIFDLKGPSFTVDTACSSSLVALDQAMQALRAGTIDVAVVGGVQLLVSPFAFIGFSQASMLSPEGLCRPFDARGGGYVRAEGGVAFILANEGAALARSAPRYAEIIASGTNSDGKTVGVSLPSSEQQGALLQSIYADNGIDPNRLAFVEAHGTGTRVGDPAEAGGLGRVLGQVRRQPLPIGSVKSNIGHMEPAAGVAGLLKAVLALEHDFLPASLHFETPNPDIDFAGLNLEVASSGVALPRGPEPRLAGISTFGFGGTNAHVVIADARDDRNLSGAGEPVTARDVLTLSAACREALRALARTHADALSTGATDARALANAIDTRRAALPERLVVPIDPGADVAGFLAEFAERGEASRCVTGRAIGTDVKIAFVCNGNGSQWAGMGLTACATNASFRTKLEEIERLFQPLGGWSLIEALHANDLAERLRSTVVAQPLLFAIQIATASALEAHGLTADCVVGHSVGEVAAAHISGALTLEQAVRVIHARSHHQEVARGSGKMAALMMAEADARALLVTERLPELEIAAINSAKSVTIAGVEAQIAQLADIATQRSLMCKVLDLEYPFHSRYVDSVREPLLDELAGLEPEETRVAFVSTVEGRILDGAALDADYWWRNVRQPVQFASGIAAAFAAGARLFVELGPRPVLQGYVGECLASNGSTYATLASLRTKDPADEDPIQRIVLEAISRGARVKPACREIIQVASRPALPAYPWQRRPFRVTETTEAVSPRHADKQYHPLLGWRARADELVWHHHIDCYAMPWLADHRVDGKAIFPGAGFAEMALAAGQEWLASERIELRDFEIVQPMAVDGDSIRETRLTVAADTGHVEIASRPRLSEEAWQTHAFGRLAKIPGQNELLAADAPRVADANARRRVYDAAARHGIEYGPVFRQLADAEMTAADRITFRLRHGAARRAVPLAFTLHPVELDAAFHALFVLYDALTTDDLAPAFVPVRLGRLRLYASGADISHGTVQIRRASPRAIRADFDLFDAGGNRVATLTGASFKAAALAPRPQLERLTYHFAETNLDDAPVWADRKRRGLPTVETIAAMIDADRGHLTLSDGEEEARLLIEAASRRAAYDILGAASPSLADDQRQVLLHAMRDAGFLLSGAEHEELVPDCPLPELDAILNTIMIEHPGWTSHAVLASHAVRQLARTDTPNANAHFGQATLDHALGGSTQNRAQSAFMLSLARRLFTELDGGSRLEVLLLGAGSGPLGRALASLVEHAGAHLTIADTNRRAIERARLALGNGEHVDYVELPSNEDATSPRGHYDIVLSAGGLGTLGQAEDVFAWLARVMRPHGLLIATELVPDTFHDLIAVCNRASREQTEASVSGARLRSDRHWQRLLQASGLEPASELTREQASGLMTIVARARGNSGVAIEPREVETSARAAPRPRVLVAAAAQGREGQFATELERRLADTNRRTIRVKPDALFLGQDAEAVSVNGALHFDPTVEESWSTLLRMATSDRGDLPEIVHLMGAFDEEFADETGTAQLERRIASLIAMLQALRGRETRVWVIAPEGSPTARPTIATSAASAGIWAFLRTAGNEYPTVDLRMIDVAPHLSPAVGAGMMAHLVDAPSEEREVVIGRAGAQRIRVRRGVPRPEAGAGLPSAPATTADASVKSVLSTRRQGSLDELVWVRGERKSPARGEVEIEVRAGGLNFRDVMWALGLLPEEALEDGFAGPSLGFECAGRITAVGPGVDDLAVGDDVIALAPSAFASHVTVSAVGVAKLPIHIDPAAAATIPVTFLTAYYALHHLAQMKAGEWVLIHGGAGGVGLAAIQIAQWSGARIIATAGTEEKRDLLRTLGVEHVLSSRTLAFADDVLAITDGDGVDVVLNSLSGEAMERSFELVKPFGRFLELGKRDFYANTKLGLRPFRRNVTYYGIDADQLLSYQPELSQRLFRELVGLFGNGTLYPLPFRAFEAEETIDAFRLMQQSGHIGKIIVRPANPAELPDRVEATSWRTRSDGAHVIIGGLGGFGIMTARWLAERGARTIFLLSRTGKVSEEARQQIDDLRAEGIDIRTGACDATEKMALAAALSDIRAEMPIVGIVHAAMVLDDAIIANLDNRRITNVMRPKVQAAAHLDALTREDPLQYFLLYSSVTTLFGNPGQAAYVAANGYLEGLARYRRQNGLPALAVGLGALTDAGYLARNKDTGATIARRTGAGEFRARHALDLIGRLLAEQERTGVAAITLAPMNWGIAGRALSTLKWPTFALLKREAEAAGSTDDGSIDLANAVRNLSDLDAQKFIAKQLASEVAAIFRMPVDDVSTDRPLMSLGMDSLMGFELKVAAQQKLGIDIDLGAVSDGLSIDMMAGKLLPKLRGLKVGQEASATDRALARQHLGTEVDMETLRRLSEEVDKRQDRIDRVMQ